MLAGATHFRRSLQLDFYSCGARSVFAVLRHFDRALPYPAVKKRLGTSWSHGTSVLPMVKLMRARGLRVGHRPLMSWRELIRALKRNAAVLVHLDGDHLAVVHGADAQRVYLADPALTRCLWRSQPSSRGGRGGGSWFHTAQGPDAAQV
jgi:ABC-type bacteriocin/lantibiotic exporter with double-glycine peptidase domain